MTDDLRDHLTRLAERVDALEAENRDLRARLEPLTATPAGPDDGAIVDLDVPAPAAADRPAALGRRAAVKAGLGLAGAAAAAVALDATPAAAANGDPVILGGSNAASTTTVITSPATPVFANATGSGIAVLAASAGGIGVYANGAKSHVQLALRPGRVPPFQDTIAHTRGEMVLDAYSNLWLCIADGTPGRWRSLAGNGSAIPGAGSLYPTPGPVRAYDSRPGTNPPVGSKTPLAPNVTRILDLKVNGTGIYAGVNTAILNVMLVGATAGNGNLTVWAADQPKPAGNTLVWGGSAGRFSTLAYSLLDSVGRVAVSANLATDVVIDVVGFYR